MGAPYFLCTVCRAQLLLHERPPLSLANNMWIGETPWVLSILSLTERLFIALYFPAAYVVKLFPKKAGGKKWDKEKINSGMRGNVSTYRMNTDDISDMITGQFMPRPVGILASVIAVTFVGAKNVPLLLLPDIFDVRRHRVADALLWLKTNNHFYRDIEISQERLEQLPISGVPDEILLNVRYSPEESILGREHAGYVPVDMGDDMGDDLDNDDGEEREVDLAPTDRHAVLPDNGDDSEMTNNYEPAAFPLQAHGSIDVGGESISQEDLFASAAQKLLPPNHRDYGVRPGSAFINEYAREVNGQRTDGGAENPNHLLGAFPCLFPYGRGGLEVDRQGDVPSSHGLESTMSIPAAEEDTVGVLTRDDEGVFVLKDQLKEYQDRGEALEKMNLYDYFRRTYDGKKIHRVDQSTSAPGDIPYRHGGGRPLSQRVPYQNGRRPTRCRVVRGWKQEVNLHFIGRWFARDEEGSREYYCAQMLLLLCPWRDLRELPRGHHSFHGAFLEFLETATADQKQIIENIKYFYECSDRATQRRAEENGEEGRPEGMAQDGPRSVDPITPVTITNIREPTESDIEHARQERDAARERIYGQAAIDIALEKGIFQTSYTAVPLKPTLRKRHWRTRWEPVTVLEVADEEALLPATDERGFHWGQVVVDGIVIAKGAWVLIEGGRYIVVETSNSSHALQRFRWKHHCRLEDIIVLGRPPSDLLRRWKRIDSDFLRRAYDPEPGMAITLGCRVALVDAPPLYQGLRDGFVVGFMGNPFQGGIACVRFTAGGQPINAIGKYLVEQLTSTPMPGDIVWTDPLWLRRHLFGGEKLAEVGDRVETANGVLPYRRGIVRGISRGDGRGGGPLVSIRDDDNGRVVDVRMDEVHWLFQVGDRVRVVEGFYEGRSGTVIAVRALSPGLLWGEAGRLRLMWTITDNGRDTK
ncbi:ATP-dependent DNA helicase [Mycena chlorophos]|uniref:ATP-dependent DNA helicase n=1 Tax=Mycena chlorophos TaxID=658473 RepID=A0A8H6TBD0_MYCCL|nr:ATP-dependent DNA helicase [Mycena chlorophos]